MGFGGTNPTGNFGGCDTPAAGGAGVWPGNGASAQPVGSLNLPGAGPQTSAFNHAHEGVHSVNGQLGDVLVNGVLTLDSVNGAGAKLSALASATLTAGALAFVPTVGDVFRLQQSALAVDNITIVNAAGKAGYQWERLTWPARSNAAVTLWSVDPVNGNDEFAGTGANAAASDLVAVKTLQEIKRRLWGLEVPANVVVRLLGSLPPTDIGTWNTTYKNNVTLTILCVLGPATGPGGAAIDNTIYSGSVTARAVAADAPSADDMQITDSAIPVSYTASGLLASGVLFKRTSGAARYWYALKDLGAKTIRVTPPMGTTGLSSYGGGAVIAGDTYSAYSMYKVYWQNFGVMSSCVSFDGVWSIPNGTGSNLGSNPANGQTRNECDRVWFDPGSIIFAGQRNCLIELTGAGATSSLIGSPGGQPNTTLIGGGARGAGVSILTAYSGVVIIVGCWTSQGASLATNDSASLQIEKQYAIHDCTTPCVVANWGPAEISFTDSAAGHGMSGKGNTSKLLQVANGGRYYCYQTAPASSWNAGSTTDASPVQIDTTSYALGALPATPNVFLRSGTSFP